jgi:hypothetical protein
MPGSRILSPLIAIAVLLVVVSGALAAVLISGGDSKGPAPESGRAIATATPVQGTATAAATATPSVADPIPAEFRARFDALPRKLKDDILKQLDQGLLRSGQLDQVIQAYEQRNSSVRVGSVVEVDADSVHIIVFTTGEDVEVALSPETAITRGNTPIQAADLRKDELVMVLSRDDGKTAFGIQALGVEAP